MAGSAAGRDEPCPYIGVSACYLQQHMVTPGPDSPGLMIVNKLDRVVWIFQHHRLKPVA